MLCVSISAIGFIIIGEVELAEEWRFAIFFSTLLSICGIFVFAQQGMPDKEGVPVGTTMFYPAKKLIAWKMQVGLIILFILHSIGQAIVGIVGMITLFIPALMTGWWRDSNLRHHNPLWGMILHGAASILLFIFIVALMLGALLLGIFSKKHRYLLKM